MSVAAALDRAEELIEGRPVDVEPVRARVLQLRRARFAVERCGRAAAIAGDLGRDALRDLAQSRTSGFSWALMRTVIQ